MLWTGEAHQSANIQTFDGSHKNSPNFLCHFSFMSQFSFKFHISHNSCIIFLAERLYSSDKKSYQSANFWSFEFSRESSLNSSCHFWNCSSFFLQILHRSLVSWHISPPYFSPAQPCILLTKGAHQNKIFQTF